MSDSYLNLKMTMIPLDWPPHIPIHFEELVTDSDITDFLKHCFINKNIDGSLILNDTDNFITYKIQSVNDIILEDISYDDINKILSKVFDRDVALPEGIFLL